MCDFYASPRTQVEAPRRGGLDDADTGISGGQAIAVGIRYDF